jgi:signal transduction histidine kinase
MKPLPLKLTLLFFIVSLLSVFGCPDSTSVKEGIKDYEELLSLYRGRKINDVQYLQSTNSLTVKLISEGVYYKNRDLLGLLDTYKTLAWRDEKYKSYRVFYFRNLINNSDGIGSKSGRIMFYAEKLQKELESRGDKSVSEVLNLIHSHISNHNLDKAIEAFEANEKRINDISLNTQSATLIGNLRILRLLTNIGYAYIRAGDKLKYLEVTALAKNIAQLTMTLQGITQNQKAEIEILLLYIDHQIVFTGERSYRQKKGYLDRLNNILNMNKDSLATMLDYEERNLIDMKLRYFLKINDKDNAEVYLKMLEDEEIETNSESPLINLRKAELAANKNDYKMAYEKLYQAFHSSEEEVATLSSEMDSLLYSQAEAEYESIEAREVEGENVIRFNSIAGISFGVTILLFLLGYYTFLNRRSMQKQINELSMMVEIQVDAAVQRSVKEEQKKIGQNLHDDLSGTIASLIKQIDYSRQEFRDDKFLKDLNTFHAISTSLYEAVRNKSHAFHNQLENSDEDFLDESIQKIVDFALCDSHFKKEIDIDRDASVLLGVSMRVEILRIVQEAVTNIVKHAKNATEMYVFLSRTDDRIKLQIGDNGKDPQLSYGKGIGLKSINNRVRDLNADLSIETENDGMHISISIPYSV